MGDARKIGPCPTSLTGPSRDLAPPLETAGLVQKPIIAPSVRNDIEVRLKMTCPSISRPGAAVIAEQVLSFEMTMFNPAKH